MATPSAEARAGGRAISRTKPPCRGQRPMGMGWPTRGRRKAPRRCTAPHRVVVALTRVALPVEAGGAYVPCGCTSASRGAGQVMSPAAAGPEPPPTQPPARVTSVVDPQRLRTSVYPFHSPPSLPDLPPRQVYDGSEWRCATARWRSAAERARAPRACGTRARGGRRAVRFRFWEPGLAAHGRTGISLAGGSLRGGSCSPLGSLGPDPAPPL